MISSLDTHFYDGKLGDRKSEYASLLALLPDDTIRLSYIEKLRTKLVSHSVPTFLGIPANMLNMIVSSRVTNPQSNVDMSNGNDAFCLLAVCSLMHEKLATLEDMEVVLEFEKSLIVQLQEIAGGACAQGRCHRLLQVILSFLDVLPTC